MASGSFNGTFSGTAASNVYPRIEWSSSSNTANNTSNVTAVLYFVRASSYWTPFNLNGHSVAININGNSASASRRFDLRNSYKYEVWRRTVTVAHNADGRKSITIKASSGGTGINLGSYSISGTANLDTIPRASKFITNKTTYEMDSQVIMKITAAASGFTHKVWINFGSKRVQVLNNPATGVNVTFTPKLSDFADQIASATTGNGSFELETYSGSTKIGSYKQTRYLTIPASVVPTTSAFSIADGNTEAKAVLGDGVNFVQGMSILNVSISAVGTYGSRITTSETVIGSTTYPSTTNNGQSVTIDLGGQPIAPASYTIKVRTKDSRGRWSAYLTKNITIWPYTVPHINATVERVNNTTQLKFTKSATVSSIKIGTTEKNTYTATTDYKLSSDTTWKNAKTESNAFATVTIDGFAIDRSYDIRLTITDKFTSTSTVTTISTSKVLLDFYRDVGVGIGKLYEPNNGVLDVGGDMTVNGNMTIDGNIRGQSISLHDDANNLTGELTTEDIYDSGWISTITPGVVQETNYPIEYRKKGDIVYFRGAGNFPTTSGKLWMSLPVGFRPSHEVRVTIQQQNSSFSVIVLQFKITGECNIIYNGSSSALTWLDTVRLFID